MGLLFSTFSVFTVNLSVELAHRLKGWVASQKQKPLVDIRLAVKSCITEVC